MYGKEKRGVKESNFHFWIVSQKIVKDDIVCVKGHTYTIEPTNAQTPLDVDTKENTCWNRTNYTRNQNLMLYQMS